MNKLRKNIRLKNYDYSQSGLYFVTVCTDFKEKILWADDDAKNGLSFIGKIVEESIIFIDENYEGVSVDKYCIMPNHIHLIIDIGLSGCRRGSLPLRETETGVCRRGSLPLRGTGNNIQLNEIIGRMKSYTTKRYRELTANSNGILWQRNFYEHIIRNDEDYAEKWQYIDENELKWNLIQNYDL